MLVDFWFRTASVPVYLPLLDKQLFDHADTRKCKNLLKWLQ